MHSKTFRSHGGVVYSLHPNFCSRLAGKLCPELATLAKNLLLKRMTPLFLQSSQLFYLYVSFLCFALLYTNKFSAQHIFSYTVYSTTSCLISLGVMRFNLLLRILKVSYLTTFFHHSMARIYHSLSMLYNIYTYTSMYCGNSYVIVESLKIFL